MKQRRILVIGSPGAGKSTFSRKLRDKTGLPLCYLDMLFHKPDRTTVSPEEFDEKLSQIVGMEQWIIDGNYQRTLPLRLSRCTDVFLFDLPTEDCLKGASSRIGRAREDMPWVETEFDPEFRQYILDFQRDQLPRIYELIGKYRESRTITIFRSRTEADAWIENADRDFAEAERMRLLFEIDKKDYGACTHTFTRNSARSIIIKNGKVAMIHSRKYDYYKFPGGGIEDGESPVEAMIRETREEAGLLVIPETVREYGYVHRVQRSDLDPTECFIQDNFYYLCEALDSLTPQALDDYEAEEAYHPEYIAPVTAIRKNRSVKDSPYPPIMFEREARVLERLIAEGLIG